MTMPEIWRRRVRQVEALDRRIVAREADVRDLRVLRAVVSPEAAELGSMDIVLANLGWPARPGSAGLALLQLAGGPLPTLPVRRQGLDWLVSRCPVSGTAADSRQGGRRS
jgi:NAD(P)-dependent dehydrogenase (short-subunit alcohol dehydrogenase family)